MSAPATQRIRIGFQDVYYAKATISSTGSVTYATPKRLLGGRSMSLSPTGTNTGWNADNDPSYWINHGQQGYEGNLNVASISDDFMKDCLGYVADTNGALYLNQNATFSPFALLWQQDGDTANTRWALYFCNCAGVGHEAQTGKAEDPTEYQIPITCTPRPDTGLVEAKLTDDGSANYSGWFTTVYSIA